MRSRPRSSQRSGVSARQIRPRASLAMKLTASGVANWAARVRSPSFSRSSSSQTTTMRPRRISSIASSTLANGGAAPVFCVVVPSAFLVSAIVSRPFLVFQWCHQALHVLPYQVGLDVELASRHRVAEVGPKQGLGDQRYLQPVSAEPRHREADAVERDRP